MVLNKLVKRFWFNAQGTLAKVIQSEFNAQDFIYSDFEPGQELMFLLWQGHFSVFVDRRKLILRKPYIGPEVARFIGKDVEELYDSLSAAILKAREESYLENIEESLLFYS